MTVARVAIVGAGPAGLYAAQHLLTQRAHAVEIDLYERLPTPWGLVRAGVAPDHPEKKMIADRLFRQILARPEMQFFGNIEIGRDIAVNDLARWYDGVIIATGASCDLALHIDGEHLRNSLSAREFVAWYNGHPDYRYLDIDLACERAVIVGNGNVALDVARVLMLPIAALEKTDIADHALAALRNSAVREVVLLARRASLQSAFNTPELEELLTLRDVAFRIDGETLPVQADDWMVQRKLDVLRQLVANSPANAQKRIVFSFLASPVALEGDDKVERIRIRRNVLQSDEFGNWQAVPTDNIESLSAGLVLRAIGYRGREFPGLPFDPRRGVIPHCEGRVLKDNAALPRLYVTGWIKRGPRGIIGTNKKCAQQTVHALLDDLAASRNSNVGVLDRDAVITELRRRGIEIVDCVQWLRIERFERQAGRGCGRPRIKLVDVKTMLSIASRGDRRTDTQSVRDVAP